MPFYFGGLKGEEEQKGNKQLEENITGRGGDLGREAKKTEVAKEKRIEVVRIRRMIGKMRGKQESRLRRKENRDREAGRE